MKVPLDKVQRLEYLYIYIYEYSKLKALARLSYNLLSLLAPVSSKEIYGTFDLLKLSELE